MTKHVSDPIFTSAAAQLLCVSEATVRLWERNGRLSAVRTHRGVRLFERAEIEALAELLAAGESSTPERSGCTQERRLREGAKP